MYVWLAHRRSWILHFFSIDVFLTLCHKFITELFWHAQTPPSTYLEKGSRAWILGKYWSLVTVSVRLQIGQNIITSLGAVQLFSLPRNIAMWFRWSLWTGDTDPFSSHELCGAREYLLAHSYHLTGASFHEILCVCVEHEPEKVRHGWTLLIKMTEVITNWF